jgi:hypothetical protein
MGFDIRQDSFVGKWQEHSEGRRHNSNHGEEHKEESQAPTDIKIIPFGE